MSMTAGGRARAREAIRAAMNDAGVPGFDPILGDGGTAKFLQGQTWPDTDDMQDIELALGWPYGTVDSIVARPPYSSLNGTEHALVGMIHDMPEADRRALIELLKVTKFRAFENARRLNREANEIAQTLLMIEGEETA